MQGIDVGLYSDACFTSGKTLKLSTVAVPWSPATARRLPVVPHSPATAVLFLSSSLAALRNIFIGLVSIYLPIFS